MDLILGESGESLAVDFKSDRIRESQLSERAAAYENQLLLYAQALQSAGDLQELPGRELWFRCTDTAFRYP